MAPGGSGATGTAKPRAAIPAEGARGLTDGAALILNGVGEASYLPVTVFLSGAGSD